MAVIDLLDRWLGRASGVLAVLGCVCLGILAVLICVDVVGRAVGVSVPGVVEIAATTVVAVAFLLLPYTLHRRGHVRSTIIRNRLPQILRRVIDVVAYGAGAVIFALIVHSSWDLTLRAWATGEYAGEGALRVPAAPTRSVLLAASIMMALECGMGALRSVTRPSDYRQAE
ncbi:MAG: TRAP transporter small permease subunit [Nitriliruptorales bacterium]|nr:TRAP transporter small permease subunit [Nitriliruptorales bacterium]